MKRSLQPMRIGAIGVQCYPPFAHLSYTPDAGAEKTLGTEKRGEPLMQIHLDILGGLAGDMFLAGVLDAFPDRFEAVKHQVDKLAPSFGVSHPACKLSTFHDGIFTGKRFEVDDPFAATKKDHAHGHDSHHPHHHHHHDERVQPIDEGAQSSADVARHGHVRWGVIRERLNKVLEAGVLRHAIGIFTLLAEVEARVHGVSVDDVEFHEVGAWDSVVDIVCAACLIDQLDTTHWSASAIPLGSGRVVTAHGPMPVPTPATAALLQGFTTLDDRIPGERVTPTGAAILRYLMPEGQSSRPVASTRVLRSSGVGFGTKRLEGISNCVRVLVFDEQPSSHSSAHRELAVVEFEVDDQSAEELALGLDRLRQHDAIFDVIQSPVFGKKGRVMTSIRLLARPTDLAAVTEACFRETTTIGLRHSIVRGAALPRHSDEAVVDGHRIRVKTVERPGGLTAKAESDDALAHETHRARRRIRHEAERIVLERREKMSHG